jgi:hypothetical protein
LAFAITGPAVEIVNTLIGATGVYSTNLIGLLLSLIGILRALGSPLLVVGFLILAAIAPSSRSRRFMLISAGIEILASLYALVMFLVFKRLSS